MASYDARLQSCPTPEQGCFAADPPAYKALTHEDPGIRATYKNIARAAQAAGEAEIGIESVIYTPVRCVLEPEPGGSYRVNIESEETPARLYEPDEISGEIDRMGWRIANAAYRCGACPDCPLYAKPAAPKPEEFVSLSSLSNTVQRVGDQILRANRLDEIREGLWSNCPDSDLEEVERLLWASEERVPLLEVTVLPVLENKAIFRRLFGSNKRLIHQILRSEVAIDYVLRYERVGVRVPEIDTYQKPGPFGSYIATTELELTWRQGNEEGAPIGSRSVLREGDLTNPSHYVQVVLNNALYDLDKLGA